MKKLLSTIVILLLCSFAFAQTMRDVVYLKNGSIIKGTVIELNPEESVKIQTADGSLFVYAMTEVTKITKEVQEVVPVTQESNKSEVTGGIIKRPIFSGNYRRDSMEGEGNRLDMNHDSEEGITILEGDPLQLLQEGKTATYEIDYSRLIITDGDQEDDFESWLLDNDEMDEWDKNQKKWDKEFRENFNKEMKHAIRLSAGSRKLHLILHLDLVDFGAPVKYTFHKGLHGGEAKANGALELIDKTTKETLLILLFKNLKGEDSFKKIGRIEGLFENLGEQVTKFLKKYQKNGEMVESWNKKYGGVTGSTNQETKSYSYSSVIKKKGIDKEIADVEIITMDNNEIRYRTPENEYTIPFEIVEEVRYPISETTKVPLFPCEGVYVLKYFNSDSQYVNNYVIVESIDDNIMTYRKVKKSDASSKLYTVKMKKLKEYRLLDPNSIQHYGFKVYYYKKL